MQVQSLCQEDPLEEGMATHSIIHAQRIPWTGAWWAVVYGVAESDMTEVTLHAYKACRYGGAKFAAPKCVFLA